MRIADAHKIGDSIFKTQAHLIQIMSAFINL